MNRLPLRRRSIFLVALVSSTVFNIGLFFTGTSREVVRQLSTNRDYPKEKSRSYNYFYLRKELPSDTISDDRNGEPLLQQDKNKTLPKDTHKGSNVHEKNPISVRHNMTVESKLTQDDRYYFDDSQNMNDHIHNNYDESEKKTLRQNIEQNKQNSIAETVPKIDLQQNQRLAELRNHLQVKEGGIHACARFSTRYEAKYLIPWLYYHKRIGISYFHMYYDPFTSNMTNPEEKKAYKLLQSFPFVNIIDVQKENVPEQSVSIIHCTTQAWREKKAQWLIDFDVDEVLTFGETISGNKPPQCDSNQGNHIPNDALVKFVQEIPESVVAVIMPRLTFGQNNVTSPPKDTASRQIELFTRREKFFTHAAKILFRPDAKDVIIRSKHDVRLLNENATIYPNGDFVPKSDICYKTGHCQYKMNKTAYTFQADRKALPRIFHYQSRSMDECLGKIEDFRDKDGFKNNWRVQNAHRMCRRGLYVDEADYTLYCASKDVTRDLKALFPDMNKAPFVF